MSFILYRYFTAHYTLAGAVFCKDFIIVDSVFFGGLIPLYYSRSTLTPGKSTDAKIRNIGFRLLPKTDGRF